MNKALEYLGEALFGHDALAEMRRHLRREFANVAEPVERARLVDERLEHELRGTIVKILPEYEAYLELTPENAKSRLYAMGWSFADGLDFSSFQLGYWIVSSHPTGFGHREGRAAYMNFHTREITTGGWDSTG